MDKKANGVGKTPPGRLSSFKKERDLSLGGAKPPQTAAAAKQASEAKKKTFKPNLNVQRTVKKEPSASDKNKDGSAGGRRQRDGAAGGRGRGRGGGAGGDRRSGHGRGQPAVIQLDSVFDKGMGADPTTRRRPGGSSRGGDDGAPTRPLFDSSSLKVDKEEEEKRLKVILQDNFIADLDSDEKDKRFLPVQLPMINTGKVFKDEDEEPADDADGGVKKKNKANVIDSDDDDDPRPMDIGEKEKPKPKAVIKDKGAAEAVDEEVTFKELVANPRGDFLFIQLPDHLPGSAVAKPDPGAAANAGAPASDAPAPRTPRCTLADLPEGYIGKVQIRRSGRTQLKIGEELFDIDLGTQVGFLQDLVAVDLGEDASEDQKGVHGNMTVLGHVKHRMVITPDWDQLLNTLDGNS